jgi:BCD family chlorophyll transporter-like MFS transporter
VVALMYVMLLAGMVVSGFVFSQLLATFTATKLVQVVQGAAVVSVALNIVALWKQEARASRSATAEVQAPAFRDTWREFLRTRGARRFLVTVGLGTAAFNMQDIVLEPYGGEVLHLGVGATTMLTALLASGALAAFATAARKLSQGADPHRLAATGALVGLAAFSAVIFAVGTLIAAMDSELAGHTGLALGAWGAVQATAAGASVAFGGALRDGVGLLAQQGSLGEALQGPATGYGAVYYLELMLLFVTLVAIGPLVRRTRAPVARSTPTFGLAEFPG